MIVIMETHSGLCDAFRPSLDYEKKRREDWKSERIVLRSRSVGFPYFCYSRDSSHSGSFLVSEPRPPPRTNGFASF